ncbi:MAG: class I SAM-dependent methyltransferase [Planctomycetaceae bacterium]|nr:class I SAM-dependent methyltransferase [Planctomycetaceae bacterium]
MPVRHRIKFPPADSQKLQQDEVFFYLHEEEGDVRLRFHDYGEIYNRPGLYEQLFYDRLKCSSPQKVGEILKETLEDTNEYVSEMRVLDLGAGNGMMGEVLKNFGVARMIGADIIPEARDAAYRDRPFVYDDYYVADFTNLSEKQESQLAEWSFNCLTTVAALGFGDIPPEAFYNALRFVKNDGWVAFNIKETFLDYSDQSGFSRMIRELIFSEYLEVFHLVKYRHRLSMEGTPLFYYALVGRKTADIPRELLESVTKA